MKKIPNMIAAVFVITLCCFDGIGEISIAQEGPFMAGQPDRVVLAGHPDRVVLAGQPDRVVLAGVASWYSQADPGVLQTTSNMERFDDQELTCAIWDVPFNTFIKVTNRSNGKSVVVRVNDRGPAKRLVSQGRIIDLTKEAFSKIADLEEGLIRVETVVLPNTP